MLYLPVIHRGYERLIGRYHSGGAEILILGQSFATKYSVVRKGIRAIHPERAARYLRAIDPALDASVVEHHELPGAIVGPRLVVPDEDLMHSIVSDYDLEALAKITYESSFLRWDRKQSKSKKRPEIDGRVTTEELARVFTQLARSVGSFSPDWWRQVGAVAVRNEVILCRAYNEHMPSEYDLYAHGDPRDSYRRRQRLDLTTALHAEAALIARAARDGINLRGADLYVSTFPCPSCARMIAATEFSRCFFAEGYSTLAGAEVLRDSGVELLSVDISDDLVSQMSLDDLAGSLAIHRRGAGRGS
jgi:deoxycytidylate deaminase